MQNLIDRGTSNLIKNSKYIYISDKNNFIKPAKLYIDNSFGYFDDFCMIASILKIETSEDFIIFNQGGRIVGTS